LSVPAKFAGSVSSLYQSSKKIIQIAGAYAFFDEVSMGEAGVEIFN